MKTASENLHTMTTDYKPCPFCSAKVEWHTLNKYWFVDHYDTCWLNGKMLIMDLEQLNCWNNRFERD